MISLNVPKKKVKTIKKPRKFHSEKGKVMVKNEENSQPPFKCPWC
jgi:hypothetical protein